MKIRSKKSYINLDEYDSRITLYSEEAFQHGITFNAKVCLAVLTILSSEGDQGEDGLSCHISLRVCHEAS